MQGCTEPSSTLQPYALAIQAHNITDPIGANANARIRKSASRYQTHGKRFRRVKVAGSYQLARIFSHRWTQLEHRYKKCSQIRRRCSHVAACHAEAHWSGCAISHSINGCWTRMRTRNAPRLLSARSLDLIANSRLGLRLLFFAFLALGFELCELLWRQD